MALEVCSDWDPQMSLLETVPEDEFVESSPKKDLDETLVEDHAVVAEDVDLQRDQAAADVVQEMIVVHEPAEESESEYNETELDVDGEFVHVCDWSGEMGRRKTDALV